VPTLAAAEGGVLIPPPSRKSFRATTGNSSRVPNRETVENIGQRIRQLRESRGMTQSQLQARSRFPGLICHGSKAAR